MAIIASNDSRSPDIRPRENATTRFPKRKEKSSHLVDTPLKSKNLCHPYRKLLSMLKEYLKM